MAKSNAVQVSKAGGAFELVQRDLPGARDRTGSEILQENRAKATEPKNL